MEHLRQFATSPTQNSILDTLALCGDNQVQAAKSLGIHRSTLRGHLYELKNRSAKKMVAPDSGFNHWQMPEGFTTGAFSALIKNPDQDSPLKLTWVKAKAEDENSDLSILASIRASCHFSVDRINRKHSLQVTSLAASPSPDSMNHISLSSFPQNVE